MSEKIKFTISWHRLAELVDRVSVVVFASEIWMIVVKVDTRWCHD